MEYEQQRAAEKQSKPSRKKRVTKPKAQAKPATPRKRKAITRCPHTEQVHYAKGMCNHCYHLYGRLKMADQCEHTDRMNYAKGLCQSCYFLGYNKIKRRKL